MLQSCYFEECEETTKWAPHLPSAECFRMPRDKHATRAKILAAVGEILMAEGFAGLGVNAVARAAKVDKVLIYRYFGSFEGLINTYVDDNPGQFSLPALAWPARERSLSPAFVTQVLLRGQLEELRRHHLVQETLRRELLERNNLTGQCGTAREKMIREYLTRLPFDHDAAPEVDPGAMFALLHAGITHLVLSAAHLEYYQGIDLHSARGWKRVEKAIDQLVAGYFGSIDTKR